MIHALTSEYVTTSLTCLDTICKLSSSLNEPALQLSFVYYQIIVITEALHIKGLSGALIQHLYWLLELLNELERVQPVTNVVMNLESAKAHINVAFFSRQNLILVPTVY